MKADCIKTDEKKYPILSGNFFSYNVASGTPCSAVYIIFGSCASVCQSNMHNINKENRKKVKQKRAATECK